MRTSLIELQQIENWLLKRGDIEERLISEARVLTDPEFKKKADWQSTSYQLIRLFGRQKLRKEIKSVESELFRSPKYKTFQQRIHSIFKS